MSRIVQFVVTSLRILRSSARVADAVDNRIAPRRADLEILGIDPAAFSTLTGVQRPVAAGRDIGRVGRAAGFAHA